MRLFVQGLYQSLQFRITDDSTLSVFLDNGHRSLVRQNFFSMKKKLVILTLLVFSGVSAFAQKYEEKQGRVIEPFQTVFARPLVVDMVPVNPNDMSVQEYGPYHFDVEVSKLTFLDLENLRAAAVYNASSEDNADMIVGATFRIQSPQKGGGLDVWVKGYPVKYANWRLFGNNTTLDGQKVDDSYNWVGHLLEQYQVRSTFNEDASQAVKGKN